MRPTLKVVALGDEAADSASAVPHVQIGESFHVRAVYKTPGTSHGRGSDAVIRIVRRQGDKDVTHNSLATTSARNGDTLVYEGDIEAPLVHGDFRLEVQSRGRVLVASPLRVE